MITLGIDCGTQSTKAIALEVDTGSILASASQHYGFISGLPPGHFEQDPTTWIKALDTCINKLNQILGKRSKEIHAIAVSGQQHGFVSVDKNKKIIRPAKLWCDTSTVAECQLIRNHFGGAKNIIEKVGMDMLPGFTAPKILWLKHHEPEHFKQLATILLPHDYINLYLTGELRMEYGDASGTAMLNPISRQWELDIVTYIDPGLLEKLPLLDSSRKPIGMLRSELIKHWKLPKDVVVSAGGGDNMMAAIGTANVTEGIITASLGTSGTLFAYSNKPVIDRAGEVAGFCDSTDAWLPLVCTMNVTVPTEAIRALFGWDFAELDAAISSVPVGSEGLIFLPYLQGERTPDLPNAKAVFYGLTAKTMSAAYMARATMEGVTLGLAYGLDRMRHLGVVPQEIRLTGGGSQSAIWRQMCADIFDCRIVTLAESEGAALGAAIQALAAVRTEKSVEQWSQELVNVGELHCDPDGDNVLVYKNSLQKNRDLTAVLSESNNWTSISGRDRGYGPA